MLTDIAGLAFYLFASVLILSATLVVLARNPVHSVLFLILAFFNAAGLFVLLGAEFVAMILVVVYVGAVAVLFLFVVMMLDIDFAALKAGFAQYLPLGMMIGFVFLVELLLFLGGWVASPTAPQVLASPTPTTMTNTHALGQVLYTQYGYVFQVAGMILLVSMIGAIVLTLRGKSTSRKQNIARQIRMPASAVLAVRKVESGKGAEVPS